MTLMGGKRRASARTAVDFAVPRSPRTSTPPTSGATALTSSASRSACWPTIAEKLIEAAARGLWEVPSEETMGAIRARYLELEGELEEASA